MRRIGQRLLKLADEPVLQGTVVVAVTGESRDESGSCKAVLYQVTAKSIISKAIYIRRKAI
jgi:hypothetical protein